MSHAERTTFSLIDTYVFLQDGGDALRIRVTESFWNDLMSGAPRSKGAALVAGGSGWLAATYKITSDMQTWEMHPNGHELLAMLSGAMAVILQSRDGERIVELRQGKAFVVPMGVWHRQLVRVPGEFLGVTYGKGTEHRPL